MTKLTPEALAEIHRLSAEFHAATEALNAAGAALSRAGATPRVQSPSEVFYFGRGLDSFVAVDL